MKLTQNQFTGKDEEKDGRSIPGSIYVAVDTKKIYIYDVNGVPKLINSNALSGANLVVDFYSDLPSGVDEESIAFVLYSQGTQWLPGSLGGTYYPSGWYIYTAGAWKHSRELVDQQLEIYDDLIAANTALINGHINNIANPHQVDKNDVGLGNVDNTSDLNKPVSTAVTNALSSKSEIGHTHLKIDITDFSDSDYATNAQGILANTALQPGDDISQLFNDEVYLQPSDNISALTNDAGYLIPNSVTSYRSDVEVTTVYSGYLLNSVITIKRCTDGVVAYATGLTDLETDWTNRFSLTYI